MSSEAPIDPSSLGTVALAGLIVLGGIVGFLALGSFEPVSAGNVKVLTNQGEVTGEVFSPGWYFINPITQNTHSLSTRPQAYTMSATQGEGQRANRNDQVDVLTNDGLKVGVDITIRYSVRPSEADTFFREYRTIRQAESRLIRPAVRSELRTEAGDINTTDIYTKDGQERLRAAVKEVLEKEFEGSGLELQAVQIRAIDLPTQYQNSIEQKEIEQQRIQQKRAEIKRERLEKQRRIIAAEAEAERNRIIAKSLTEEVLTNRYIEAIDSNSKLIITGGSSNTPFILDSGNLTVDRDTTDLDGNTTVTPTQTGTETQGGQ